MAENISPKQEEEEYNPSIAPPTKDEITVKCAWPDLPSWVLAQYTAKEWLWMPMHEKAQVLGESWRQQSDYNYKNEDE